MDPVQIQAIAAIVLPAVVKVLKTLIPSLEGKALLYANLALNVLVAIAASLGLDVPMASTLAVGAGFGLAGSKMVDLAKYGTSLSQRHK